MDELDIKLYQGLESSIIQDKYNTSHIFDKYDIIVFDESHYFLNDSIFSNSSDLILKLILKDYPDKLLVFMTATPSSLIEFNIIRNTFPAYNLIGNYSFIENLYFYRSDAMPEIICKSVPEGEKLMYFGPPNEAHILSTRFEDSVFICSKGNSLKKYSSTSTATKIEETDSFNSKFLFTTRVLDNGISIKDEDVTHIIIADSLDPITLIQMLGRKRIEENFDTIKLYIRDHKKYPMVGTRNKLLQDLKAIKEYYDLNDIEEFTIQNKKNKHNDSFDNDMELNIAKEMNKKFKLKILNEMIERGYEEFICDLLQFDKDKYEIADTVYKKIGAVPILEKYLDRKLFKEEQRQFTSEFLDILLDPRKEKGVGIRTIQGLIADNRFEYWVYDEREGHVGIHRNHRYWIIRRQPN